MWRRADIRVVPAGLAQANQEELQSLRLTVARAEAETEKLAVSDPAVREQLTRNLQILHALLNFAERQESDRGKSPTALEVQKNLNHLQGQMMCEACHTRAIATSHAGTNSR